MATEICGRHDGSRTVGVARRLIKRDGVLPRERPRSLLGIIVSATLASVWGCSSDASELSPPPYGVWAAAVTETALGGPANLGEPQGVAVDTAGNVYVADSLDAIIVEITPAGTVRTLAGMGNYGGPPVNGPGSAAIFSGPQGVAVDAAGNVYVADTGYHLIRMITPAGIVSTFAGTGAAGSADGASGAASFRYPEGIAVDAAGNLYVADTGNNLIRMVTPAGDVSTLAGTGTAGSANGASSAATFDQPYSVAVDASGNVYVGDNDNGLVRKLTPAGDVSTLAVVAGASGVAVDAAGNVYVASYGIYAASVDMVTPTGDVSVYAQGFTKPTGVAVDASANVYASDFVYASVSELSLLAKGELAVNWVVPDLGVDALPIEHCTATASAAGQATATCEGFESCTLTGLASGVDYSITVTSNNGDGDGPPSSAVLAVPN
jgi:sugar lactone lactonase YvrE